MRFSLATFAIIGISGVLAAPLAAPVAAPAPTPQGEAPTEEELPREGQPVIYESEGREYTIQPYTRTVELTSIGPGPTGLTFPGEIELEEETGQIFEGSPPVEFREEEFAQVNNSSEEILFGNNPNPNEIGGSSGNAGSALGTGSNAFGTTVYNDDDSDQRAGQATKGRYGGQSGGDTGPTQPSTPNSLGFPTSNTIYFRLVVNVTGDDPLGVRGFYVGTYHVSAGSSLAHLTNFTVPGSTGRIITNSTNNFGNGRVFTVNGTVANVGNGANANINNNSSGRNSSDGLGNGRVFYTNGTDNEVANSLGTTVTNHADVSLLLSWKLSAL